MPVQNVSLSSINANPYQKRHHYNDIPDLARTIATDGLQQVPKARLIAGEVQLKFGHRRCQAFRWLAENWKKEGLPDRYQGYTVMPLDIEDLSDEQMFRGATIENNQRKDLSPVERMEEMKAWVEFGYNSKQIAEMYPGMSDATVRGLLAFDSLQSTPKTALHEGKITQGTARIVNTLQKITTPDRVKEIVEEIVKEGTGEVTPEAYIVEEIDGMGNVVELWWDRRGKTPRARDEDHWLLDMKNFPNDLLPVLTVEEISSLVEGNKQADALAREIYGNLTSIEDLRGNANVDALRKINPDYADKLTHVLNPPACNTCPFYGKIQGTHYCGVRVCYERKERAWHRHQMHEASKKLHIPIYNPNTDGAHIVLQDAYASRVHAELFKSKNKDLRLAFGEDIDRRKPQNGYLSKDGCFVVATGSARKKLEDVKEVAREKRAENNTKEEKARLRRELESKRRDASREFALSYAPAIFAAAFKDISHIPALCALLGVRLGKKDTNKKEVLAALHAKLARRALDNMDGLDWSLYEKGPTATAKFLQGVAKEWGVKLPADFLEIARKVEPVAPETGKGKK